MGRSFQHVRWSGAHLCLAEWCLDKLRKGPTRVAFAVNPLIGRYKLKVADIELDGKQYVADVRTGSVFDPDTGKCLTGPSVLDLQRAQAARAA